MFLIVGCILVLNISQLSSYIEKMSYDFDGFDVSYSQDKNIRYFYIWLLENIYLILYILREIKVIIISISDF